MTKEKSTIKKPVSEKTIFRNMMITIFAVAGIFLLKNLILKTWVGAVTIGICLFIFTVLVMLMNKFNVNQEKQQLVICISVVMVVFCVSINSGDFYSDDFPLYLAVVGVCGLFLKPQFTLLQGLLIDVLLIISYVIHPQKADPLSQYILCLIAFAVATFTFYMVINRGRTYIEISEARAREAEELLERLKDTGEKLQSSCQDSMDKISRLDEANRLLEASRQNLQKDSDIISRDSREVSQAFDSVHEQMQATQEQIGAMNQEVRKVEGSLEDSGKSIREMTAEIEALKGTVDVTYQVFESLREEISQISHITMQLNKIAGETTRLALNASIEAARAGSAGSGFAVVASKVQNLAEDSNQCAAGVASIVQSMEERIATSAGQLENSTEAINQSVESLKGLEESFETLTSHFGDLYGNIESQNSNIQQVDAVFGQLKEKIMDMSVSSDANQASVESIADSINIYRRNIDEVIGVNKEISELSSKMMEASQIEE
ncbi:MAG: methyl-accepting chemotaxis protein [Lachnospiraceae bacterium]|nr:methyl-accepting chemotaxis protein [Lachnospiraceae bacterium]MDD7026012.1 methyl-accepting chemotaxis protein [Lachnospiraceae bacterium]